MKRVLLTGGSGFVGRHCLPLLAEHGYDVHVISSNQSEGPHGQWHLVDLMDHAVVAAAIQSIQPSHLLHLAWITEPRRYLSAPENLDWLSSSLHLLRAFHEAGGERVVMSGSCAEYDWNYGWCREDVTPLNPDSLYGQCKKSLQSILAQYARHPSPDRKGAGLSNASGGYCKTHSLTVGARTEASQVGLSWAWGRLFFLYGPHGSSSRIPGVVIESLLKNQTARCSHGNQIRDFLHIGDAASALVALLDSDVQGTVNVASGEPVTIRELVLKIADHFGRRDLIEFGAIPTSPNEPPLIVADVRRLRNEVGWQPAFTLASGIDATLASAKKRR